MGEKYEYERAASPYVRYLLGLGRPPSGRMRGWVAAEVTRGRDRGGIETLLAQYGEAVRAECVAHGFIAAIDQPLASQSRAAQEAATRWREELIKEGSY